MHLAPCTQARAIIQRMSFAKKLIHKNARSAIRHRRQIAQMTTPIFLKVNTIHWRGLRRDGHCVMKMNAIRRHRSCKPRIGRATLIYAFISLRLGCLSCDGMDMCLCNIWCISGSIQSRIRVLSEVRVHGDPLMASTLVTRDWALFGLATLVIVPHEQREQRRIQYRSAASYGVRCRWRSTRLEGWRSSSFLEVIDTIGSSEVPGATILHRCRNDKCYYCIIIMISKHTLRKYEA